MNQNEKYFIHLLACSINEENPALVPEDVSKEEVGKIAIRQNLLHTVYEKAEEAGCLPKGEESVRWKDEYVRNKVRDLRQQLVFDDIAEILNANSIRFIPLKGLNIKPLYPKSYLRRMTDLDILIKEEELEKAYTLLSQNGFLLGAKGITHYNLKRPPSVNVELHRLLFNDGKLQSLFKDVWDNAAQDGAYENCFRMSAEDLTAHIIIHYAHHFCREGGIGVRAVTDFYILKKTFPEVFNSKELKKRLNLAGVLTFYEVLSKIGEIWFECKTFEENYEDIQHHLIRSLGTYGNEKTLAIRQAKLSNGGKHAKAKFVFHTLFPPYKSKMCKLYPWLKKAPFLLPLCWILRVFKLATQDIRFFKMTKAYFTVNNSDSDKLETVTKRLGFTDGIMKTNLKINSFNNIIFDNKNGNTVAK